jgi:LysM repeat protein
MLLRLFNLVSPPLKIVIKQQLKIIDTTKLRSEYGENVDFTCIVNWYWGDTP